MGLIGVNILSQFIDDWNRLIGWLDVLKPNAIVVMDDLGRAGSLAVRYPQSIIIHRSYQPEDNEFPTKWSPEQFIEAYCRSIPTGVVIQCCNEPSGYGDLVAQSRWFARVMDLSPVPLALPQWGVGHPKEDFGSDLDELIFAFGRHPDYLFCTHEYFQSDPIAEPYRTGRFKAIVTRFQQLGIPLPKMVITEAGRDIGGGINDGWKSVYDESTYATKLEQQASIYLNTPVRGMCIFCAGHGAGNRWDSFDIQNAGIIQSRITKWNQEHPMADWTSFDWGTSVPNQKASITCELINRRAAPSATATDLGDLHNGDVMTVWGNTLTTSNPLNPDPRYNWRKVQYPNQIPQYVAVICGLSFTTVTTLPAGLTQVQWDRLNIANNTIKIASAEIDKLLLEVKPSSSGGF